MRDGTAYSWGGHLRLGPTPNIGALYRLTFFASPSCETPSVLDAIAPPINASTSIPGVWYLTRGPDVVAPPGTVSVLFEVRLQVAPPSDASVDFDNVYFGPQGIGPPSELVSVPTLSGSALLLLAAALVGAAIWRLTMR